MYKVVESKDRRGIVYETSTSLDQGWKLQGGVAVAVCKNTGRTTFYQAMIKKDKED